MRERQVVEGTSCTDEGNDGFVYTRDNGKLSVMGASQGVTAKAAHEQFESSRSQNDANLVNNSASSSESGLLSAEGWQHVETQLKAQQEKISTLRDKIGALEESLSGILIISRETLNINKELFERKKVNQIVRR